MIDRSWIGHKLPPSLLSLERGRLAFFAKSIGETDAIYFDVDAARNAGHPDLPVPPTFLFAAELDSNAQRAFLEKAGVDFSRVLHGEQGFTYHAMLYAGDEVTVASTITDIYDKKGGALEFVIRTAKVSNRAGDHVADLRTVLVVRNG